jgi:DNA-binding MarR family transcriptional regulator
MVAEQNIVAATDLEIRSVTDPVSAAGELLAKVHTLAIRLRQNSPSEPGNLARAEHAVLDLLERQGTLTVPQIARERCTSRQNIQILVDRLEAVGRVELASNPAHKRSALVHLTEKGKQLLEKLGLNQKQVLAQIASNLSEVEVSSTVEVLRRIQDLLSNENQSGNMRKVLPQAKRARKASAVMGVTEHNSSAEEFPVNLL